MGHEVPGDIPVLSSAGASATIIPSTPASWKVATSSAAQRFGRRGRFMIALPVAKVAAATPPTGMATGKFQEATTVTRRGRIARPLYAPVGQLQGGCSVTGRSRWPR